MAMDARWAMPTDLLRLVQWLSPAFPTGAFAYSHGLETAVVAREVTDAPSAQQWITDILRFGAGRTDAILLAHTLRGADLRVMARALAPSAERLRETETQGAAFAAAVTALGVAVDAQPLPLAVGTAARCLDIPAHQVIALYLHSFAASLGSAATRFVPLGQNEGQRLLSALHPLIETITTEAAVAPLEAIASSAFRGDLASMQHETLDVRIFRT